MRYLELQPTPALRPFVTCIWILEGVGDSSAAPQPVFPDGRAELIVHYGDRFHSLIDGHPTLQPRSSLVGQITRPLQLLESRRVGMISARLVPAGVGALLGDVAAAITGREVELYALAGARGEQLEEEVRGATSNAGRVDALQRFLLSRLDPARPPDPRVDTAVRILRSSGGQARVDGVARRAALSVRQLHRRFRETVGLTPKQYARIVRFQQALGALQAGHSLTQTALGHGYHDHAHFTREFRALAGMPPSMFLRHRTDLSRLFIESASDSYKTEVESAR